MRRKTNLERKIVAVVIGGDNIDVTLLSRIIERALLAGERRGASGGIG